MIEVEIENEVLKPFSFYFFVNTKSGNQKGRLIMNIKNHNFNLKEDNSVHYYWE